MESVHTAVEQQTKPYQDQKPGTSGLRKKVVVFKQENYLENFVQSIFDSIPKEEYAGKELYVSGDGRYYNDVATNKIVKIAFANGVGKVIIGQHGHLSTPAMSHLIRKSNAESFKCVGGILLTASHNPGGETEDFGVKFNCANGGPAPESITNKIFEVSTQITRFWNAPTLPDVDITQLGDHSFNVGGEAKEVSVIDRSADYVKLMKEIFNFDQIKALLQRSDFSICFDGMHGVSGPYAEAVFVTELEVTADHLMRCNVLPDFGKGHPDPNLTYAADLANKMGVFEPKADAPSFAAACDGDADRNMILGKNFFVTPSDSLAIIVANHKRIPYFKNGISGAARSMPTSAAVDIVLDSLELPKYETPTGWKFFGNLLDSEKIHICGEESFGTGSSHVREKDGLWAVLAWLQILADFNAETAEGSLISVEQIVREHWAKYGRNYYQRYDYENCETADASKVFESLKENMSVFEAETEGNKSINFSYTDPVDGSVSSNQGYIFRYADGSRFVFRLSGTGSSGATVRIYLEKFNKDELNLSAVDALAEISKKALEVSKIHELTGRDKPTVIT